MAPKLAKCKGAIARENANSSILHKNAWMAQRRCVETRWPDRHARNNIVARPRNESAMECPFQSQYRAWDHTTVILFANGLNGWRRSVGKYDLEAANAESTGDSPLPIMISRLFARSAVDF
jgi:hypothetical protein